MFGLSKLADKDFVIGFVLPVLIAAVALALLLYDVGPVKGIVHDLKMENAFTNLTLVVLALWVVAILLLNFNRSLYRLLEGYYGPLESQRLKARERDRLDVREREILDIYGLCGYPQMPPSPEQECARGRYAAARAERLVRFPDADDLMPTRFGNVIKAFETYSNRVYGLEGTTGWTRLVGVIPSQYASVINDARSEVDFCVNLCALSVVVALVASTRFVLSVTGMAVGAPAVAFLFGGLAALGVAYLANRGATERAGAWGETVKAAFDLYLPAMAKQLGYELPSTRSLREDFWDAFNGQILLHEPIDPEEWKLPAANAAEPPAGEGGAAGGEGDAHGGEGSGGEDGNDDDTDDNGDPDDRPDPAPDGPNVPG